MLISCVKPRLTPSFVAGDITNELVRHFLIESSPKGVKLKGCPNEPYFGQCCPPFSLNTQSRVRCQLSEAAKSVEEKSNTRAPFCHRSEPLPNSITCNPTVIIVLTVVIQLVFSLLITL